MRSSQRSRRWLALIVTVVLLAACGGGGGGSVDEDATDAASSSEDALDAATNGSPVPSPTGASPTGAPTASLAGEPVDACAVLTSAEAQAIVGTDVGAPTSSPPTGSLLGDCTYYASDFSMGITLSARPAAEYQSTVDFYRAEVADVTVPGATAAVFGAEVGMMMQPEGAAYMLVLTLYTGEGELQGRAAHTAAAEVTLRT